MAENVTRVTLPQLADLSLNCPDLGTLNFNILHILLQVLIKQVQREDVTVEFRGKESDKISGLIKAARPGPPTSFSEYNVSGGPEAKKSKSKEKPRTSLTELQTGRRDSKAGAGSATVVVIEPPGGTFRNTVSIDKAVFDHMKDTIDDLKTQMKELVDMPGNLGLIDATKDPKQTPMLEMFQILTLKKRMDANEAGVEKVVTLLEDVVKAATSGEGLSAAKILNQTADLKGDGAAGRYKQQQLLRRGSAGSGGSKITAAGSIVDANKPEVIESYMNLEARLAEVEEALQILAEEVAQGGGGGKGGRRRESKHSEHSAEAEEGGVGSDEGKEYDDEEYEVDEEGNKKKKCAKILGPAEQPSLLDGVDLASLSSGEAMTLIQAELLRVTEVLQGIDSMRIMRDIEELKSIRMDGPNAPPDVKITRMEAKFAETVEHMTGLNTMYTQQITQVRQQISDVQHEVSDALDRVNMLLPGGDSSGLGEQGMIDLYNKFMHLQEEMNVMADTANKLIEEKESIQVNIESMLEQIDLLKIVKANREDLEEALGDKADACAVNRKVSHDQFDQACDDLTKGLEEALEKLQQQEEMWQQALEDIQREIGSKLDKMEVEPLRDFVNDKLRGLQEKFKKLSHLKQETEAAGTRNKLLRNVNCISCDKDVVMRREMDQSLKPKSNAMQPTRNMAPYLAYELDQLRKQQKCIPGGKNLHHFENAIKGMKAPKEKDHICNRYCGGSHTVTTPQQRVTRLGHFLEQYGPEVAPMGGDEFVKGNDNKMYKAREPPSEKQSRAGTARKDVKNVPSTTEDVVTKDGSQSDRLPVSSKEAEDIITKDAAVRPRPKTSIEILPTKLPSSNKLQSREPRSSMEPIPETASAKNVATGPEEAAQEG